MAENESDTLDEVDLTNLQVGPNSLLKSPAKIPAIAAPSNSLLKSPTKISAIAASQITRLETRGSKSELEGYLPTPEQYAKLTHQYQIIMSTLPEYLSKNFK